MLVSLEESSTLVRPVQLLKTPPPMSVTEEGMLIPVSFVQPAKAADKIFVSVLGRV